MNLSNTTLSVLVVIALALAIFAALPMIRPSLRDLCRRRGRAVPTDKRLDVLIDAQAKAIQRLEGAVKKLAQGERELGEQTRDAVRHVGVVRFDAFEDMGGRLSFSAALLDGQGDGVVITSINGRQDTRVYAKGIQNGTSIHNLSDEERQAIREAMEATRQIVEAS